MKKVTSVFTKQNIEILLGVVLFIALALSPSLMFKSFHDFVSLMCLAASISLILGGPLLLRDPDDFGPFSKMGLVLFLVNIVCSISISWILTGQVIVVLVVAMTGLLYTCLCCGFFLAFMIYNYFWSKKFWADWK